MSHLVGKKRFYFFVVQLVTIEYPSYTIYSGNVAIYDIQGAHLIAGLRTPKFVPSNTAKKREFLWSVCDIGRKVSRGYISDRSPGDSFSVGFIYDCFWKSNHKPMVHEVEWNTHHTSWVNR